MQRHLPGQLSGALAALLLVAVLAACGGGESGGGGEGGGRESGGEATFDPGPVELAKAGSERPLGERAFVRYEGIGAEFEPDTQTDLGVTVEKVDEGDSDDIDGLGESTVPYYVHLEFENHGDGSIRGLGLASHLSVRGSDGEDYDTEGVIEISGEFEQCPDADADAVLAPKQALADCMVVTLSEGVSPEQVRFRPSLVTDEEPIAWTVE